MKYKEELDLADLELFTNEDIGIFREYNIRNIGQLLGATRGLINNEIFQKMIDGDIKLKLLENIVPKIVLENYRRYQDNSVRGLRTEEDNNARK